MSVDTGDAVPEIVVGDAPDVEVTSAPTIIVEAGDSGDDGPSDGEVDRAVDTAIRITRLEDAVTELATAVGNLSVQQEVTADTVEYVAETVADQVETVAEMGAAVDETIAEDVPVDIDGDGTPDEPPETARKHWFFR